MVARNVTFRGPVWEHLFKPLMEERWGDFPPEQLFEGPAGTGKSIAISHFVDLCARMFAGCRILVLRKTRVSLSQSWMVTFEKKVLHPDDPIMRGASRSHRQSYVYGNGSEIVVAGMDNETRVFSTEYDLIYINESVELSEEEVESLYRALRNGVMPFQAMIFDCNPDSEYHWLNQRCNAETTVRRVTRLWDNPGYWTGDGWTPDGADYRSRNLHGMHGLRHIRLVLGEWCTAEGAIIPLDKSTHLVHGRVEFPEYKRPRLHIEGRDEPIEVRFFYGAFDHGFRNPGTFQVWAVDDQKRPYLVREYYRTRLDEDAWAKYIVEADATYMLHRVVCDSASPEKIVKFNRMIRQARDQHGHDTAPVCIPARKGQAGGKSWLEVQAMLMRRMFEIAPDGQARAYVFTDATQGEPDVELKGKPIGFWQEGVGWTYEKYDRSKHRGMPKEIGDPDKPNHGIDAASYGFEWLETHDLPDSEEDRWGNRPIQPGTWADADRYWKKPGKRITR